jgi:hypothetical protein
LLWLWLLRLRLLLPLALAFVCSLPPLPRSVISTEARSAQWRDPRISPLPLSCIYVTTSVAC